MKCRRCDTEMVNGIALQSALGNYRGNLSRGATIYPFGSVLVDCVKCPECGHSVGTSGVYYNYGRRRSFRDATEHGRAVR
jgi:hypothetical protein